MLPSSSIKTKILILGPLKCGKTTISNYLADSNEMSIHEYRPTRGVRIVEFESNELELNGERVDAEVELWDCSGDRQYERCWPAIRRDTHGVILVCRPDKDDAQSLLPWYAEFVERAGMNPAHVLILLHHTSEMTNDGPIADFRLPPTMSGLAVVPSNVDHDGENLRLEFNSFLCKVIADAKLRQST
ncbi:Rab-like protein 5 [Toxocara canis]|uniref:Rab-like protein 5 n=1 Tax=Toxocara canis TaxID=6265 RepID=A0A0B2VED7_TOXCA|nr:Rab-like protein 5 [Toxocara canis]